MLVTKKYNRCNNTNTVIINGKYTINFKEKFRIFNLSRVFQGSQISGFGSKRIHFHKEYPAHDADEETSKGVPIIVEIRNNKGDS